MLKVPKKEGIIIEKLNKNRYEAYLVGGCVRDMLMGKTPHDYDIATSATPEQIMALFENCVPTGIKHGTVTVILEGEPIEVTTFRADGEYNDYRRPDSVKFVTDIKFDLSRRDFTVNAIAYNQNEGIVDLFGGKNDIANKILRCVGNPEKRFLEDALRIMRLFRFACTLGFSIDKQTLEAAKKHTHLLQKISIERITNELLKLICGDFCEEAYELISGGALGFLGIYNSENLHKISLLPKNTALRLFALLRDDKNAMDVLQGLKCSNNLKQDFLIIKSLFAFGNTLEKSDIKRMLRLSGDKLLLDFLSFIEIFENKNIDLPKSRLFEIIENNEPYKISHLAVDGNDLKRLGFKGEKVGEALEQLLSSVIENPSLNTKENLINMMN